MPLILVWCLLPVVWIISLSFKSQAAVTNGSPGFFPSDGGGAGWQNYKDVLDDGQFRHAIFNSIGISLIATLLSVDPRDPRGVRDRPAWSSRARSSC